MSQQPFTDISANDARTTYKCGPVYFIEAKAGKILADHVHDAAETLWIISGKGKLEIADEVINFEAPCILKVPGGVYHKFLPETDVRFVEQKHEVQ